jgi:membrane peptidoglycan carboxypeptidase
LKRWLGRLLRAAVVLALVLGALGAWAYQRYVIDDAGTGFTRDAILEIISQESPVYTRDGAQRLGVFFDVEHRAYVPYAELPEDWIHAIVAAEDGDFFTHPGIDAKHVVRAAWQNLRAGAVVAGGSTLTQQTAKNLFYRPDRTLRSKAIELVNALRLERHFSKQDILEFYANQFHVSANGRGLGIAARYFFAKAPRELTTKECAFLAGMVKAPSRYNPFLGQGQERRDEARARAETRTSYVLRRMVEEGYLSAERAASLQMTPLEFRKGTFQYDRSVILDEVQKELEEPTFVQLFERAGIDNPSTAGIQVITTIDATAQREATYALWHHLSELGPVLERTSPAALAWDPRTSVPMEPGVGLKLHEFSLGRVATVGSEIALDLGGRACTVDAAAMDRLHGIFARAKSGASAAPDEAIRDAVRDALPAGAIVLASVRQLPATCDLELRPKLQGAVVVLDDGQVRAMVGGNDNRNFNRVTTAQRQLGSTWKPLVYLAAIQLGWLPTDLLDNRRGGFAFRESWYYPRPDHKSDPFVSMSLAGARSENLASAWLLYHLADRLNAEQFRQLVSVTDLGPRPGEDAEAYKRRLRDDEGIRSSPERYDEYAFTRAREDVLGAMAFSPHPEDAFAVRSLVHGRGMAAERARVQRTTDSAEKAARLSALAGTYLGLEETLAACQRDPASTTVDPETGKVGCGRAAEGWMLASSPPDAAQVEDAWIDGRLHGSTLAALRAALSVRSAELAGRDPWEPDVLALSPEFRVLVSVRYVTKLAASLGVESELPTALSLPFGAADVTLLEMATTYQAMLRGERWSFPGQGYEEGSVIGLRHAFPLPAVSGSAMLIAEIRDAVGNILYRAEPRAEVVADARAGELVGDILRNVVKHGTGRRAFDAVKVGGVSVALDGKTGTTNDYRNAAFVGHVARGRETPLRWGDALTVAAYVGYDDNAPMRRGSLRVQGASGALPAWIGTAQGLVMAGLARVGGECVPSDGVVRVEVDSATGGPGVGATTLTLAGDPAARRFAPLGMAASEAPGTVGTAGLPGAGPVLAGDVPDPGDGGVEEGGGAFEEPPSSVPAAGEGAGAAGG